MIDTHSHIYSEEFDADRAEMIQRAKTAGVLHIILPNVDSESLPRMLKIESEHHGFCHAAIGLHPTSVKENFEDELEIVERELKRRRWIAIGEIGIDLYWDKTFFNQQVKAFVTQIEWAIKHSLPVIIHIRDSFNETMQALEPYQNTDLKGIFHSFTGNAEQAEQMLKFNGFMLGINGVVTFKNSTLSSTLSKVPLNRIVMETDAPYLTPVPYRGKRNENAYLEFIKNKLAQVYSTAPEIIRMQTSKNAIHVFGNHLKTEEIHIY